MRTDEEIKKELEIIKNLKKSVSSVKYPCTQTAVSFIQLQASEEILEWVLENEVEDVNI